MLDIRRIRLEPDVIKELLARRGEDVSKIDALLALDVERRKVMTESESRKAVEDDKIHRKQHKNRFGRRQGSQPCP